MHSFVPAELKAHFSQQVDAVGTHEAAATFLGISRQRVGQLCSTNPQWESELPTFRQIFTLESVCRQSLILMPFGRKAEAAVFGKGAMSSAVECATTAAKALQVVYQAKADGVLEDHEVCAAQKAARLNMDAARKLFDDAMRLTPTNEVAA